VPVRDTRGVTKADLRLNDATPAIEVDPATFEVRIDGELVTEAPVASLPLAQRYALF
jgi:urease subunit alpha